MDIKLTHNLISEYLEAKIEPQTLAKFLSLCGPTVDRMHQLDNDWLYEIEAITNRVDTACALGVAREAAAILTHHQMPTQLINDPYKKTVEILGVLPANKPVSVQVLDSSLAPHLAMVSFSSVSVKPSSPQIQALLNAVGQRPLNNIVDISNEITLRLGLPVHIFDLDKIKGQKMVLRTANKGESIVTLDQKKHKLENGDIVFEDGEGNIIDLCGIMGGADSQVDESTHNALLLVPIYDPKRIRSTSLRVQNRTLSSQIFEKRPDPMLVIPALIECAQLITKRTGAVISSSILEINNLDLENKNISVDFDWLNNFIGVKITPDQIKSILASLGFTTSDSGKGLNVNVPSWRYYDINIKEDIAEEVARVYGYFQLPSILPPTTTRSSSTSALLKLEYDSKVFLAGLGFTEIYNYSLISKAQFDDLNLNPDSAIKLQNPLSSDYEYLRTNLISSLLYDIKSNQGKSTAQIDIFELANEYHKRDDVLPLELPNLAIATQNPDFFYLKGIIEAIMSQFHIKVVFNSLKEPHPYFSQNQSTTMAVADQIIGIIGVIKPNVLNKLEIKDTVIASTINFALLSKFADTTLHFKEVDQTSPIIEDITITTNLRVGDLMEAIKSQSTDITKIEYLTSLNNKHSFRIAFNGELNQDQINVLKKEVLTLSTD